MMRFSNLRWHRGLPSSADTYLCLRGIFLLEFQDIYLLEKNQKPEEMRTPALGQKGFPFQGFIRAHKNREGIEG